MSYDNEDLTNCLLKQIRKLREEITFLKNSRTDLHDLHPEESSNFDCMPISVCLPSQASLDMHRLKSGGLNITSYYDDDSTKKYVSIHAEKNLNLTDSINFFTKYLFEIYRSILTSNGYGKDIDIYAAFSDMAERIFRVVNI